MTSQRQARRIRDRQDFVRATTVAIQKVDPKHAAAYHNRIGENAGNTYREHVEDEIRKAVRVYNRIMAEIQKAQDAHEYVDLWGENGLEHKRKAARGYIRGLCKALLIYERSYDKDNKQILAALEREFLNEGRE